MIRVHVICEGQTEELFVNEILQPYFSARRIFLQPALVGKPGHKGGYFKFDRMFSDVRNRLLGDTGAYCTTFFDFYGLPEDFPGKNEALRLADISQKAASIQQLMTQALEAKLGQDVMQRFIPYVQMYEFEALLFSEPVLFAQGIDQPDLTDAFQKIVAAFDSPEHINNSTDTAPSKRVQQLVHSYQKPLLGALAALEVGLPNMRARCALFNDWLNRLEQLAA